MKKKLLSISLALLLSLGLLPVSSLAADIPYPVTGGSLYFDAGTGTITKADDSITKAVIPSEISGFPVTKLDCNFQYARDLQSISFPDSITEIPSWALDGCENLTSVRLPAGLTEIGDGLFCSCNKLSDLTIPDSVTSIGEYAFSSCSALTLTSLPSRLTSLGGSAFQTCTSLTNITLPDSLTDLGSDIFLSCENLKSVTFGKSTTEVSSYMFRLCERLSSVTLNEGITRISDCGFSGCSSLTEIVLPSTVKTIGGAAFDECSSLKTITIPVGLTEIEGNAFRGCSGLTDVYYGGTMQDWIKLDVDDGNEALLKANIHYLGSDAPATPAKPDTPAQPFTDVPAGAYYADAVKWAVENGVTTGTTATTFSPDATVTRGQAVTFLWRAMGKPSPESAFCPFADVKTSDYFYQPVLWAVEQGITNGTDATHFSPGSTLTRAHIVTFLWRTAGNPADTGASQWYADAVKWGETNDLLSGTAQAFTPAGSCPRSDVVTYLYRADQKSAI